MRKTCLNTVFELAKKNKKVIFIGSDLGPGVLDQFKQKYPDRFFMEGVSEQSIIGISAGLAMEGFKPYVNTISTFITRRCYEQIAVDLCLHNLPVKLIGNGGGLVYAPLGPTHQAIEDLSIMRVLPNMSIIAPCDAYEMKVLMKKTLNLTSPLYIRLAKGGDEIITSKEEKISFGKGLVKIIPKDILIVSTGITTQIAIKAAKILNREKNIKCGVIHLGTVKPIDTGLLKKWFPKVKKIITIEENLLSGGFGSLILEQTSNYMPNNLYKIKRIGLKEKFVENYGTQEELLNKNKINFKNIINTILKKGI